MEFFNLLPGDSIENEVWNKTSPYHDQEIDDNLSHLLDDQYRYEIVKANAHEFQSAFIVSELNRHLQKILPVSSIGIATELLMQINFVIVLQHGTYPL